jgi:hypothetical protein
MKKLFFLFFFVFLLGTGCGLYQSPVVINQPGPYAAIVSPGTEQPGVWRPDITRALVCNKTQIVYAKVWVDGVGSDPPLLELVPEQCQFINTDLGDHTLYVEGQVKAGPYGWRSVGRVSFSFKTGSASWGYVSNTRELWFYESDFPRLYNSFGGGFRGRTF